MFVISKTQTEQGNEDIAEIGNGENGNEKQRNTDEFHLAVQTTETSHGRAERRSRRSGSCKCMTMKFFMLK